IVNHRLRFKRHPCMNHSLFELLMTCMDNDPLRRPDMVTIHRRLDEITDNTNTYPSETTDQHHHGHSDDEYVYCTKNNQKNPSHCKDVDSHIQGLELTKNRRESPYKEVELPYKELDLPYKLKGLETLYRKSYHMTSHPPPPDLLPTGHHTRALLIKEDIVDIDHIIMKQDKLECDEKSLTPEDKPEVFGQVIENSMDTTPNCLSEKLPDGMGDFYLQDVMPSINCCTYVTEVKGLMYERKYL
ncbi:uncharacterized protein LOC102808221, partial [Saccoglossus kowalevskii]|uniref:Uncharacterized protein LOC102808221 n=1 Tax=Saccoglossus kowalevskii TaxID=10224 RepID=A0ABM0MCA6_SACKO